ncbi:MAG TPA: nitroreductase [bacterium]|nr:nitroreductase [bacterium]
MEGALEIVLEVIKTRRSVARLKPDPVERALIERCLEAAVWSPNHHLTEPWQFFVLEGETRRRFAEIRRDLRRAALPNPDAPEVQPMLARLHADTLGTPVLIAVTSQLAEDSETREEDLWATFGAAYAFMLGLWSAGVGSYFRTGAILEHPSLRALLDVPPDRRVTGIIYAGYPAELPTKRRTPAADRTVWLS